MWSLVAHALYADNVAAGDWELFSIFGELRGSGVALGYLFIRYREKGSPPRNAKSDLLERWLKHFSSKWGIKAKVTLTDKDSGEIRAMGHVFPDAKHQLCFWHGERSGKTRISTVLREPGHYDVTKAIQEFPEIDPLFLPLNQLTPAQVSG